MEFCGTPIWDWNLTWHSNNPDFTPCFEETVLAWTPIVFIWVFGGIDIYNCFKSRLGNIPWNYFNIGKLSVTILLALTQVALLLLEFYYESITIIYPVTIYTPIFRIITFGLLLFLQVFSKAKGLRSSGAQFFFWSLIAICDAFAFRTTIATMQESRQDEVSIFIIKLVYYPLVVCSFLLNCWADVAPLHHDEDIELPKNPCPDAGASFLSHLVFHWFWGLAWKGYQKSLESSDLWDLNQEDKSNALVPVFEKYWRQLSKNVEVYEDKAKFSVSSGYVNTEKHTRSHQKQSKPRSILPTLLKVFGPILFVGAFLKFLQDLLIFASPQILKLLISYVSDKDSVGGDEAWKGYFYAFLLFASSTTQTIILNQYFHRMLICGLRIRTTLVAEIYKKALVISSAARKESTVGEIVNLMSVDAQRLMDVMSYINMIWSGPLQIALSLYFLWGTLGPSVLAGLAVMILLIPINAYISAKIDTLQMKQMKQKDNRVKLMNEILSGIKVLKLYHWEPSFVSQIMEIRENEMKVLKDSAYLNAATTFIWNCAPFIVAVASFASFVLSDPKNILDSETAFVALSLFNILRFPLSVLPMAISTLIQANVSLKRLNKFMNAEELDPHAVTHDEHEKEPLVIENGNFSWDPESDVQILRDINLTVRDKSLVAICGTVGSGKSSLLSVLLGEMFKKSGRVNTKGLFAYVAQQAWIQNATVRENILFGRPYEPTRYAKVLDACALRPDLEILAAGDKTEIGEKGINLSGGQKQRVSLARAVYNNADVYLLDDVLSAVDSHVGKHIFEKVIGPKGLLRNKTRVLVTHAVTYLPYVDEIVVMKDGGITEQGSYRELLDKKGAFADFLVHHLGSDSDEEVEESDRIIQDLEQIVGVKIDRQRSRTKRISESENEKSFDRSFKKRTSIQLESGDECSGSIVRKRKASENLIHRSKSPEKGSTPADEEKLIQVEKTETGRVKWSVYLYYMQSIGWGMVLITVICYIIFQGLSVGSDIWLSIWSNSNQNRTATSTEPPPDQSLYLGVYGGLGIGQGIGILMASMVLAFGGLRAAAFLHFQMLERIMHAPMTFFDTNPIGRIVNRFAKDVDVCDNTIRLDFETFLNCLFNVIAVLAVISYSTPIFMTVILPIGILYILCQRFYVATSRQLKRLESVSRSPIYSHFNETITGCTTIRAYAVQERFILESEAKVDLNQACYFPSIVANRWLAVRLETVGNFIIFFAALFAVLQRETLSAGTVGLSISYSLSVTQVLNWLVRMSSALETNIVAVERIQEYSHIIQEADWENESKPKKNWPDQGAIVFDNYQTRYREGLDLVLKGISCDIKPSEKVGVVGRTGAGKSSLTLALFRIVEAVSGSILVDGENISKIGLRDLRSRLTIIPQDPVLFSGTLRINLDPFNQYSDEIVWRALEHAHLKSFAKSLSSGLQHEVSEGGENLSVGQRQLICLARALLRKTKILILDEATAAVDLETDDLIQQTIRTEFNDSTVVTIAHRLNTIMDSMRVIVLDKGEIREFDTPEALLNNKESIFYGMAKDAGLV